MIKDNVVSLYYSLRAEICCELLFTCLIATVASPNFRFYDIFLLVMDDNDVHPAAASLHLNVHNGTDEFNKLVEIGEKEVSAYRLLWRIWHLQNSKSCAGNESRKLLSNNSISMRPVSVI